MSKTYQSDDVVFCVAHVDRLDVDPGVLLLSVSHGGREQNVKVKV